MWIKRRPHAWWTAMTANGARGVPGRGGSAAAVIGIAVALNTAAFAGPNRQTPAAGVMGTAGGVSRFSTQPKGASAMANTTHTPGKAGQPGQPGQSVHDAGKGMMDKAKDMAGDVADKAKDI